MRSLYAWLTCRRPVDCGAQRESDARKLKGRRSHVRTRRGRWHMVLLLLTFPLLNMRLPPSRPFPLHLASPSSVLVMLAFSCSYEGSHSRFALFSLSQTHTHTNRPSCSKIPDVRSFFSLWCVCVHACRKVRRK